MSLEERVFGRCRLNKERLLEYGFKYDEKGEGTLVYRCPVKDELVLCVSFTPSSLLVTVRVVDQEFGDEYLAFRYKDPGAYGSLIAYEVEKVLNDIRDFAGTAVRYLSDQANRIDDYCAAVYGQVDFPFADDDETGVYREAGSDKWYAIIMTIPFSRLTKNKEDDDHLVCVMNVKADKERVPELIKREGLYECYHMNKKNWISIALDDTLSDAEVIMLINDSYDLVQKKNDEKKFFRHYR